jgi:hypothetical protein
MFIRYAFPQGQAVEDLFKMAFELGLYEHS